MVISIWFLQTPALLRRPEGLHSLDFLINNKLNDIPYMFCYYFLCILRLFNKLAVGLLSVYVTSRMTIEWILLRVY